MNDRHSIKYSLVVKVITDLKDLRKNEELYELRFMHVIDNSLEFHMNYAQMSIKYDHNKQILNNIATEEYI